MLGSSKMKMFWLLMRIPQKRKMNWEEEKEEDTLQQLLFLEQLLLNDLNALEEKQKKEDEIEELSSNDQLRMIESLEQTKRLIFEVKQKQRDEMKGFPIKSPMRRTRSCPIWYDFFQERSNYEPDEMSFVPTDYQVGPGDVLEVMLFGRKTKLST